MGNFPSSGWLGPEGVLVDVSEEHGPLQGGVVALHHREAVEAEDVPWLEPGHGGRVAGVVRLCWFEGLWYLRVVRGLWAPSVFSPDWNHT